MSTATEMVDLYIDAEKSVLLGKNVQWNGRTLTKEDLAEIRAGRLEWEVRVATESCSGSSRPSVARFL
jgi:hypothetical protein